MIGVANGKKNRRDYLMSSWSYIKGIIEVSPFGRTQEEKRYVLETILNHLPRVTGSEEDMKVHIVQEYGYTESTMFNEFGYELNATMNMQSKYLLCIESSLRDREFHQTFKEFQKWLIRLSKRLFVYDILIEISSRQKTYILSEPEKYQEMKELPSWSKMKNCEEKSMAWWEYLIWEHCEDSQYPKKLADKYNKEKND